MKKRKLKRWVKILLTVVTLIFSFVIYIHLGRWGELAQNDIFYLTICISGWFWIFLIQFLAIESIWRH